MTSVNLPEASITRFDEDSDEIGVLICTAADDDLFWVMVARDAMDEEYEYGTDEAAVADGLLQPGTQMYDEAAVARWVRTKVKQPVWRWYRFATATEIGEEDDEGQRGWFVAASETDRGAFFGAVIDLAEGARP